MDNDFLGWLIPSIVTIVCAIVPIIFSFVKKKYESPLVESINNKSNNFNKEIDLLLNKNLDLNEYKESEKSVYFNYSILNIGTIIKLIKIEINDKPLLIENTYILPNEILNIRASYLTDEYAKIDSFKIYVTNRAKSEFCIDFNVKFNGLSYLIEIDKITRTKKSFF